VAVHAAGGRRGPLVASTCGGAQRFRGPAEGAKGPSLGYRAPPHLLGDSCIVWSGAGLASLPLLLREAPAEGQGCGGCSGCLPQLPGQAEHGPSWALRGLASYWRWGSTWSSDGLAPGARAHRRAPPSLLGCAGAQGACRRGKAAFAVPRGALQALQGLAATYCGMVRQLCERLRWHEMAALFDCLTPRLNFGVCPEGQPLCRIAGVYPARARALLEAGLTTVEAVANASVASVEVILRKLSQFESHRSDAEAARRQEVVVRQTAMKIVRGAQDRLGELLQNLEDEAEEEQLRVRRAISGTG
ncbi:unnamed protein product, partial [Polarella glacialis]